MSDAAALTILAQISDAHLRLGPGGESVRALKAAVRSLTACDPAPQAVLITGDLIDTGTAREYKGAREILQPLQMPLYVVGGNHDDRNALRSCFEATTIDGTDSLFIQYATYVGGVRLVVCDTATPGRDEGSFGQDRLAWLQSALEADREAPTIIAMHHPPFVTGIRLLGFSRQGSRGRAGAVPEDPPQ